MLVDVALFVVGLIALYYGAEGLIAGASSVALRYGIRPILVGLTIVALGTSMPEFVVNLLAAVQGESALALGNIVGSNIANIALILGVCALVVPLTVQAPVLKKEYPFMLLTMLVFYGLAWDGAVTALDGGILLVGLVALLTYLASQGRTAEAVSAEEVGVSGVRRTLYIVGGIVGLAVGAHWMVESAVSMADRFGIDHAVVGLTVVALGTSLPELAASLVGTLKDEADLSFGNVVGSNMLNVLFVVGLVALFRPLDVDAAALRIHFPVMIGFALLLLPLARTHYELARWEGGLLVSGFVAYMGYLIVPYL
ncbi:calcium/sodium antiporter [Salisaeta longa]|uniref:calcium/sodium antiporter n=1 Tax=Salisaeta longa TaxID=503170 RepID=UPI0003B319A1|nr:calcium/sodium antiporter [Salisaeta longa]